MTADDEGDDSSRLLSRQGPDLQDGGASSETRDHIFASRDENPVYWPPAAPGAERHLRELRDDDDISEVLLSPPPFQWSLPVGGASAAPPIRADVANGGSGHLFRQPRGGSRGGAAVAVAPSQLGGAWVVVVTRLLRASHRRRKGHALPIAGRPGGESCIPCPTGRPSHPTGGSSKLSSTRQSLLFHRRVDLTTETGPRFAENGRDLSCRAVRKRHRVV